MTPSAPEPLPVVLGLDVGGSSTKVWLQDATGAVLARVSGPGGNHRSSGTDPSQQLRSTLAAALEGIEPGRVVAASAGVAGAGSAAGSEVRDRVTHVLTGLGVRAPTEVRTDLDIAFLAATPAGTGALLLSGTGAVAGRYRDARLVRRCDGLGWRLGDEGSGWWIGSRALRRAVAALDGRGPETALLPRLTERLAVPAVTGDARQDWVRVVAELEPAAVAALVPTVVGCARDGDEVALRVLTSAADRLIANFDVVEAGDTPLAVSLAGGVLTADGPVRDRVVHELRRRGHRTALSPHPVRGALALAAALAGWAPPTQPEQSVDMGSESSRGQPD